MSKPKSWQDIAGTPILDGDYVVYAALWSRSALKYGRIVGLTLDKATGKNPHVQLVTVDRAWDDVWELQGGGWKERNDPDKCRVQTLMFLDRMLVVTADRVPEEVKKLLDKAYAAKAK